MPSTRTTSPSPFPSVTAALSVGAAGVTTHFEIPRTEPNGLKKVHEFVLTTNLSLTVQDEYIYTKVITIAPKYVFYNASELYLQIVQEECFESFLLVRPGEAKAFHWPDSSRSRFILIRLGKSAENFSEWDWSSPLELQEVGWVTVRCRHQTRAHNYLLVKINRVQSEGMVVAEVREESQDYPAYRLENYSRHFSLAYWQKGKEGDKEFLDTCSLVAFGWTDYRLPRVLQVRFYCGGLSECPIDLTNDEHEFSLDDLEKRKEINIKLRRKGGSVLHVATLTDGHTKVLRITDVLSGFDASAKDEKLEFNYFLDVRTAVTE